MIGSVVEPKGVNGLGRKMLGQVAAGLVLLPKAAELVFLLLRFLLMFVVLNDCRVTLSKEYLLLGWLFSGLAVVTLRNQDQILELVVRQGVGASTLGCADDLGGNKLHVKVVIHGGDGVFESGLACHCRC